MYDTPVGGTEPARLRKGPIVRIVLAAVSALAVLLAILAFMFIGTYTETVPTGQEGLLYEGGPIEGKGQYLKTIPPGTGRTVTGLFNPVYHYPTTKRSYIIGGDSGDEGAGDSITAPSKDGVEVQYEVAVYFTLNREKLRTFHEDQGLKYAAWTDEGWAQMLREIFRQQIEAVMQDSSRRYDVVDIYSSEKVRKEIEQEVRGHLKDRVNSSFGEQYFCGVDRNECDDFGFVIKRADIPQGTKDALQENRNSQIAVQTKKNEILQKRAEAQALRELQKVLESCGQVCVMNKAIESGKIDFWVLPAGSPVIRNGGVSQ